MNRAISRLAVVAVVWCGMIATPAQYQLDTQKHGVNTEIYGRASLGTVRYGGISSGPMLPSEARYQNRASGLLPSELRMNAHASGNPAYKPAAPHSWSVQGSMGSVRYAPPAGSVPPATLNPYLMNRGGIRY